jgi:hypothetical protein
MQPHFLVVVVGRTWWAQSSMSEFEARRNWKMVWLEEKPVVFLI